MQRKGPSFFAAVVSEGQFASPVGSRRLRWHLLNVTLHKLMSGLDAITQSRRHRVRQDAVETRHVLLSRYLQCSSRGLKGLAKFESCSTFVALQKLHRSGLHGELLSPQLSMLTCGVSMRTFSILARRSAYHLCRHLVAVSGRQEKSVRPPAWLSSGQLPPYASHFEPEPLPHRPLQERHGRS